MAGKFEIERSADGQYYFHLKAGNGEKILASERYTTKASAETGIAAVKKNAPDDGRYERRQAADGQHHFVLKAGNHEIVGVRMVGVDPGAGTEKWSIDLPAADVRGYGDWLLVAIEGGPGRPGVVKAWKAR